MPLLNSSNNFVQVKVGTREDHTAVFPVIESYDKKGLEADTILSSTAGAVFIDSLSVGISPTLVTFSSGSQKYEIYATGIHIDKSVSEAYGTLGANSVVLPEISLETEVRNETAEIFCFADGYLQHDGISDILYDRVEGLIFKYDQQALKFIKELFDEGSINSEVINDTLSIIGDIEHPETSSFRLELLEHFLFSPSHYVRDGAILGIANLNDLSAIESLKQAVEREKLSEIKNGMLKIISLLEIYGTSSRN